MYPAPYAPSAVAPTSDPSLSTYIGHTGSYHQTLYPTTPLDNRSVTISLFISNSNSIHSLIWFHFRYLSATENLFQYRPLGSYYTEYHTTTAYNGFIDVSLPTYDSHQLASKTEDKLYCSQQLNEQSGKYSYLDTRHPGSVGSSPYAASSATGASIHTTIEPNVARAGSRHSLEGASSSNSAGSSPVATANGVLTPKIEDVKSEAYPNVEPPRQTVLMWGTPPSRTPPRNNGTYSPPTPRSSIHPASLHYYYYY